MDSEAIWLSDEADLHSLGLNKKGDTIALKSFCYLKLGKNKTDLAYSMKEAVQERTISGKRRKSIKEKIISIGRKNYDEDQQKYVIVGPKKGGDSRNVSFSK